MALACIEPLIYALAVAAAPDNSIVVLDVQAKNISADTAAIFTEVVTSAVHDLHRFRVITSSDIKTMVGFKEQKQSLGCDEDSCMAELGGALGVDLLLASQVGKVGQTYIVSVKLLDVRRAETLNRASKTVKDEVDEVVDALRSSVRELLAPSLQAGAQASQRGKRPGVGPIASWAVGAVALGTGGYFGLRARDRQSYANDSSNINRQAAIVEGERNQDSANVAFAVGAVALAAGLVWWLLEPNRTDASASISTGALMPPIAAVPAGDGP